MPPDDPAAGRAPVPSPAAWRSGERGTPLRRAAGLVRAAGHDLLGLVLPVACAGCGAADVPWCDACASALGGPARRCDAGAGRLDLLDGATLLPVWAVGAYAGPVRHAVGAWKDGGRTDLDAVLGAAVRRAAVAAAAHVRGAAAPVLVVPVPSTGAARRRRGRAPVEALAAAAVLGLRDAGVAAVAVRPLRRVGGPDLAGLSARARGPALAGRVRLRRGARVAGCAVVLVDDVLTTGATLAACHAVLTAAGAHVRAGCAAAATAGPGPGPPTGGAAHDSSDRPNAGPARPALPADSVGSRERRRGVHPPG